MLKKKVLKVIAFTSGKGGVGKTNVVANLAVSLAMTKKNVLIIDADLGLGNLDVLLGLAPKFNIGHLIRGEKTLEEIIIKGPQGIKILPAASGIQELTNLSMEQKVNLFSQLMTLDGQMDVLLIDTAAGISQNVLFFNMASQEIIVITSPEPTSIVDAYALMKVLCLNYGEKKFRLLVNFVNNGNEGLEVYRNINLVAERYLNVSIDYIGFIPLDKNLPRAVRKQKTLVELFPDSRANKCFVKLARFVNELPPPVLKDNIQFFGDQLSG